MVSRNIMDRFDVLTIFINFFPMGESPMYPSGLVDCGIIVDTLSIKDLLRLARFFSMKFSRKKFLYRHDKTIYFCFRRRICGATVGIIFRAKTKLSIGSGIYYRFHRNRIIMRKKVRDAWYIPILDVHTEEVYEPVDIARVLERGDYTKIPEWLCVVDVDDYVDLVEYAYYARDVLLHIMLDGSRVALTGFLTGVFPRVDPCLYVFKSPLPESFGKSCFIDLSEGMNPVEKIGIKTLRYVCVINVRGIAYYDFSKKGIRDNILAINGFEKP